jgi:hypothetical protein
MGVSITRIVKFIRKGKGVIVAQSRNVYNYTYKEWTQFYGLSGRLVNWDGIINVSDFSVGDTMVINGTVSDKQRITISLYAKVTAIDTNRAIITAQSLYYIASGENGAKGDRGPALRGPQAWSDCAVGYVFQSGASGEEYKDIVLYGGYYYSCIKPHTKTASNYPRSATDTNSGLWQLADPVEIVATKILLAQYALVKNLGVEAIDMKDANGNIIFQAKDGNVTCNSGTFTNGTFTNVKVIGSIRNPFNLANDSFDADYSDNVAMLSSGGGWLDVYSMPWDVSQNGRRLTIVNYKWGGTMAQGQAEISAPNGKYFFEDGIQKSKLKVSREIVEMIGYGTTTEFYGWIVLNRIDLMTSQKYGHCLKALAFGTVSGGNSSSNTSITSNTFDGSKLTVVRQSEGLYRVFFPSTWFTYTSNCRVILTGRGVCYGASSPVKATMHSLGNGYFDVVVSDDATRNDGSFDFIIYNGSDFDILK